MKSNSELLAAAKRHLYGNYRPAAFVVERAAGCELFDVEGRRWLDFTAGVAVCSVGHAHPDLARAIATQAAKVMHVSNYFYNEPNILLAGELCKRTGMDRVLFCNSGAEATESLLKLARRHHFAKGEASRTRIIAFHNAFHGRTLGALSMTGTPKYQEGFGPLGPVTHVPYGDVAAVRAAMSPDVAAVIVEPIQGEGGVLLAPPGFLKALREICNEAGALLLVDEVQTGVGRTGSFLAIDQAGIRADAIALAKGLGGGFPVGAMLTTEALAGALPPGTHGTTFGGNPLACAAALEVLAILDREKLVAGAAEKGAILGQLLGDLVRDFPTVFEAARGRGLLWGLVLRNSSGVPVARDALVALSDAGLLLTAAGERVLRFTPALTVTAEQLHEAISIVRKVAPTWVALRATG